MKFKDAIEKLESGYKITRASHKGSVYIMMKDKKVISIKPTIAFYPYVLDIMISDGWLIDYDDCFENKKEHKFCDIIPLLAKGHKAKLKEWNETYIFYDKKDKDLLVYETIESQYFPVFDDFIADDWGIIE